MCLQFAEHAGLSLAVSNFIFVPFSSSTFSAILCELGIVMNACMGKSELTHCLSKIIVKSVKSPSFIVLLTI